MEILPYTMKWLELVLRWGHVLFAILCVGNSFLFNYLDNKLNKKISSRDVDGEGYLMHSGYYYKLTRLKVSPPKNYLRSLTIFKWQSYLTFITGILLLGVIYYYKSGILMVDKKVLEISPSTAIILSLFSLRFFMQIKPYQKQYIIYFYNICIANFGILRFNAIVRIKICFFKCWINYWNKHVCKCFYSNYSKSNEYY